MAALIGGASAAETFTMAQRRFRGLPLSALTEADMASNKPDPTMYTKTVAAELGCVAAFVSHSWSDEGGAKFSMIHDWATEYAATEAESPARRPDKALLIWLGEASRPSHSAHADATTLALLPPTRPSSVSRCLRPS